MAWFWQKKKEETEKQTAENRAAEKKQGLLNRITKGPVAKDSAKSAATPSGKKKGTAAAATPIPAKKTRKAAKPGAGFGVLIGPVVTEKAARLAETGTYIFAVTPMANKIAIAQAVSAVYDVHPTKVAVINTQGKPKVFAQRFGRRASTRKAYVTLKKGEAIELFEGTEKK